MDADPIPEDQSGHDCEATEDDENPMGRSVGHHVSRVHKSVERSKANVGTVSDKAETCKEPKHVDPGSVEHAREKHRDGGEDRSDNRSGPHDEQWMWVA